MVALFVMLVKFMLWASTATVAIAQAKPGCPDRCGDVGIPYPFGLSSDCFLNETYAINCNDSFTPPKPFTSNYLGVISLLRHDLTVDVLPFISSDCYFTNGTRSEPIIRSFDSGFFTISDTKNKFMAVGCDTSALVKIYRQGSDDTSRTGCMSICNSISEVQNNSCSGVGCCQVSIPKGMQGIESTLDSYYNHTNISDFNNCSYAFVVENTFNFSSIYLQNFQDKISELPMVLDWAVGDETCEVAEKNKSSFLCRGNSACDKSYEGPAGYHCKCLDGYQGNPYLDDGCTDINECEDPVQNQCQKPASCVNLLGNYTCSCPKGYFGDGRKPVLGGTGCTRDRKQIKVVHQVAIGIGIALVCFLLLLVMRWLYMVLKRRKDRKLKEKFFKRNGGVLLQNKLSSGEGSMGKTKFFTSKELKVATDRYNESRILGRGGQGTVYKGMLPDGRIVAVKKSKIVDEELEQFINEVVILSQIDHRNVVKLLGCCLETEVPLLVYEFVPNGTLYQFIHDQSGELPNSWEMRLRIATEVANAIWYLHSAASVPIYHRDIKSTNILLDAKFRAKISDFGTSKSIDIDQTHLTTQVKGTFGYLDPEYFQSSQFTEKSDVYSFGVVLVELLTGEKPISAFGLHEKRGLVAYFISSMEEKCLLDVLDARVVKDGGKEELMAVGKLAERCLNMSGRNRPTMKEALMELERVRMLQGYTVAKPKQDEGLLTEPAENWDFISSSVTDCLDCSAAASSDVQSLMFNTI